MVSGKLRKRVPKPQKKDTMKTSKRGHPKRFYIITQNNMKTTVTPNRSLTTKRRSKTLTGEGGRKRIATIVAEQDDRDGGDTTRTIRIVTDTEGVEINKRDRKNDNGGSPTELEAMNQLYQAREELQDEAEDRVRGQRVAEREPDESCNRTNKDTGETKTEQEAADEIEAQKREIITKLR